MEKRVTANQNLPGTDVKNASVSSPPASITRTEIFGSSDKREAIVPPALPEPTIKNYI